MLHEAEVSAIGRVPDLENLFIMGQLISKRVLNSIKSRVLLLMYLTFASGHEWDFDTNRLRISNNYLHWSANLKWAMGLGFPLAVTPYLLFFERDTENTTSFQTLVSYIIGWAENLTIIIIVLIGYRFCSYRSELAYIFNQIIKTAQDTDTYENFSCLSVQISQITRMRNVLYLTALATVVAPLVIGICFSLEFELVHRIVEDMFEVQITIWQTPWKSLLWTSMGMWSVFSGATWPSCFW